VNSNPELALRNILCATSQALQKANMPTDAVIDSFVAALAGAGDSQRQQEWQSVLGKAIAAREVQVVADAAVLFAAAELAPCAVAVALVIGTGSIAWARDHTGRVSRSGGHGPSVGDPGSGFWMGNEAAKRLAEFAGARGSDGTSPSDVARRSKAVFELAKVNRVAREIISEAAEHIAKDLLAAAVEIKSSRDRPVQWLCAGGVAVNQPSWLETIRQTCARENLFLDRPLLISDPVVGAVNLALQAVNRAHEATGQ
jgi:N-acetylglucosamine kinase-like BadF-type ATPase